MSLVLISVISYFLGAIPFSNIIAKRHHQDLQKIGSKNVGTANVYRATGKIGPAFLALLGDAGKGALAVFLAERLSFLGYNLIMAQTLAGFFVIAGHNWSVFLKFKGGRGLASLAGVLLFLNWRFLLTSLILIIISIFLVEALRKKKMGTDNYLKSGYKRILSVLTSQVLGRMVGITAAFIFGFIYYCQTAKTILPAFILVIIKHINRTKDYLS